MPLLGSFHSLQWAPRLECLSAIYPWGNLSNHLLYTKTNCLINPFVPPLQNKSAYFITKNLHHSSSNSCNPDKASFLDYQVMRRTWCIFQSHYSVVYALPWYPTQAPSQVHSCHMLPLIFIISAIMHLLLNRILALGTCPL